MKNFYTLISIKNIPGPETNSQTPYIECSMMLKKYDLISFI